MVGPGDVLTHRCREPGIARAHSIAVDPGNFTLRNFQNDPAPQKMANARFNRPSGGTLFGS
eukprot:9939984-Alexandrium_andersonii.AAC.1